MAQFTFAVCHLSSEPIGDSSATQPRPQRGFLLLSVWAHVVGPKRARRGKRLRRLMNRISIIRLRRSSVRVGPIHWQLFQLHIYIYIYISPIRLFVAGAALFVVLSFGACRLAVEPAGELAARWLYD